MSISIATMLDRNYDATGRARALLGEMSLAEKIGQMCQLEAGHGHAPDYLGEALRAGQVGSVINVVDVEVVNELQRIAVEESRLGIPLLVGRDVSLLRKVRA